MKVAKLKTTARRVDAYSVSDRILKYSENNDYPQKVREVLQASPTGIGCMDIATRFVFGDGFKDKILANYIINSKGRKANQEVKRIISDFKTFGGFAFHVNYNALLEPIEIQHIPFEHCRIAITDNKEFSNQIAVHPNWTNKEGLKKFKRDDIKYYPLYNSITEVIIAQLPESGIQEYGGQVYYYAPDGLSYPLSPFDAVITDMSTEEAISTVLHRNAKHNFLPAGMIIRKGKAQSTTLGNEQTEQDYDDGLADEVAKWQGDERAAKMIVVDVDFEEETPSFVPFSIQNFDRMFDSTSEYVEQKIGKLFMQPPILRGVDVGAGFGADLMKHAFDFYNSIVESDRKIVEETLGSVIKLMPVKFSDYSLEPLKLYIQNETTTQQNQSGAV
jgi:hypothetical protein